MNEETLFHLVLEKPSDQRDAFLKEACAGDEALKQRVEALLHAHDNPASFLNQPAAEAIPTPATTPEKVEAETTDEPPVTFGPGSLIGPYKLLQKLGEGGMGSRLRGRTGDVRSHAASPSRSSRPAWTRHRSSPASSRNGRRWR